MKATLPDPIKSITAGLKSKQEWCTVIPRSAKALSTASHTCGPTERTASIPLLDCKAAVALV